MWEGGSSSRGSSIGSIGSSSGSSDSSGSSIGSSIGSSCIKGGDAGTDHTHYALLLSSKRRKLQQKGHLPQGVLKQVSLQKHRKQTTGFRCPTLPMVFSIRFFWAKALVYTCSRGQIAAGQWR